MGQEIFMQGTTPKTETNLFPKNEGTGGRRRNSRRTTETLRNRVNTGFTVTLDQLIHTFTCDMIRGSNLNDRKMPVNDHCDDLDDLILTQNHDIVLARRAQRATKSFRGITVFFLLPCIPCVPWFASSYPHHVKYKRASFILPPHHFSGLVSSMAQVIV